MSSGHKKNQSIAIRGLLLLLLLVAVVALVLFILFGKVEAFSAFMGGMACLIPNAYFARYAFKFSGKESAKLALRWFYIGEAVKLLSTAIIIGLCLTFFKPLNMFVFFAVFIVIMMLNTMFLMKNMTF